MSALSSALEAMADGIAMFETSGAVLTPDAIQAIARFLRTATDDARKLERMLERRLTSEHIPNARFQHDPPAASAELVPEARCQHDLPPPIPDKVVPFRRVAPRHLASASATVIPIAVKPQEPPQ